MCFLICRAPLNAVILLYGVTGLLIQRVLRFDMTAPPRQRVTLTREIARARQTSPERLISQRQQDLETDLAALACRAHTGKSAGELYIRWGCSPADETAHWRGFSAVNRRVSGGVFRLKLKYQMPICELHEWKG